MAMSPSLRPSILFRYGRVLTRFKRRSRALAVFRAVTREDPRHQPAWSCIGFLLAEREELEGAVEAFRQAADIAPTDAASHFNIAFVLQRLGRHAEAIAHFERALELDPALERARRGLERSVAAVGQLKDC